MSEGSKPEVREYPGCGCGGPPVQLPAPQPVQLQQAAASPGPSTIGISITPTTGGQFDISVDRAETVDNLKKIISKRLKVAKERICLLHRDRQLRDGTLEENRLQDGSRLTLLPSVETGLLAQRPEQSVMQALESLSDSQVNDFLSGKAPLNLTMRLGDHMMLIQLQLSTVTPANGGANAQPASSNTSPTLPAATRPTTPPATLSHPTNEIDNSCPRRSSSVASSLPSSTPPGSPSPSKLSLSSSLVGSNSNSSSSSSSLSPGPSLFSTPSPSPPSTPTSPCSPPSSPPLRQQQQQQQQQHRHSSRHRQLHHPARARYTHQHYQSPQQRAAYVRKIGTATRSSCPTCAEAEPTSSSTTSTTTTTTTTTTTKQQPAAPEPTPTSTKCSEFSLILSQQCDCSKSSTSPKKLCPSHATATPTESQQQQQQQQQPHPQQLESSSPESSTPPTPTSPTNPDGSDFAAGAEATANPTATLDTRALVEASRNLTQKLKQLSSEENAKRRQGAIIESMHHHGKGVYTGTFSGTLNPALQDRHGRPKRDISTIIHILNDLLCATPATAAGHYRYHRHQSAASHRASASSAAASAAAAQPTAPQQPTAQAVAEQPCSQDSANPRFSGDVQNDELFKENETTKSKMRRLRLVLEQRREKMRARRQARAAPYTTKWAAVTPDADSNAAGSNSPGEAQNEPELQPCSPEPVVA